MKIFQSFNKTVLLLLFSLSSLQAGNLSGFQIGYSHNESDSPYTTDDKRPGGYLGWDIMKTTSSGFGFGVGLDTNTWNTKDTTGVYESGYTMYTLGGSAKIGYTFQNKFDLPLKFKAGYGYGLAYQGSNKGSGGQYDISAEYTFFEGIGFGIKHKHVEANILTYDMKYDSLIGYFSFSPLGN